MLSIGKLAAGQARYYLDQAEGRVDVVDSVAEGIEDYYVGGREARGEWIGAAAAELGLRGAVAAEGLRAVLAGVDPRDGLAVRGAASRVRLAGFDLTFSAPKSVSVLFGIGEPALGARLREAHDYATREALGYLEQNAAAVRRGHGGVVVEEASGLVAAAFRHRTSRAGDLQLHTHVLVANLGRGPDGRWSALDGRRLYSHARAASFVYQAVLRAELSRTVGVEWTTVRDGIAEVVGVPPAVRKTFSRRRTDVEAALEERGTSGARAAEAAALATRRAKDPAVAAERLVDEWRARAGELGFGIDEVRRVVGRTPVRARGPRDTGSLWKVLAGPIGLTRRSATFTRRDVVQAMCERLPGVSDAVAFERAADDFLASEHAVALIPGHAAGGDRLRRRDGRAIPASGEVVLFSTREHLALEQRLMRRVVESRDAGAGVADDRAIRQAIADRPTLNAEQRALAERACGEGELVTVVVGAAGSGKTFALGVAREVWQADGRLVLGVAVARRAASGLRDGSGIESTSVAAMLRHEQTYGDGLPEGAVLVVDEAGMVPTVDLARLLGLVERARGKLVLVGDHRQLPALEAGGVFRGLVQRGLAIELRENVRQVHRWEREALDELRDGRVEETIARYDANGRIVVADDDASTRRALVRDWLAAGGGEAVMIAHRRADVAELNRLAREELARLGRLGPETLAIDGGDFAVGDLVVVKRNEPRLDVQNGARGRVIAVDVERRSLTVDLGGRAALLDAAFVGGVTRDGEPALLHGYAITGHVAQGATVDQTFVLATAGISQEWAYVALSRGRESNRLYVSRQVDEVRAEFAPVSREVRDPIARLVADLRGSAAQVLAIDAGTPVSSERQMQALLAAASDTERERRSREMSRWRWVPGGLNRAERREVAAREALAQEQRRAAEREHGSRPPLPQREIDAQRRPTEDVVERRREREGGFGRER